MEARSLGLHASLPCGPQGPHHPSHRLLPSQVRVSRKAVVVEWPATEPAITCGCSEQWLSLRLGEGWGCSRFCFFPILGCNHCVSRPWCRSLGTGRAQRLRFLVEKRKSREGAPGSGPLGRGRWHLRSRRKFWRWTPELSISVVLSPWLNSSKI